MSDAGAGPGALPLAPRRPATLAEALEAAFRVGWRPAGGWVCVLVLAANGVAIPLLKVVWRETPEPLPWGDLTTFALMFTAQAGIRGVEKVLGASA